MKLDTIVNFATLGTCIAIAASLYNLPKPSTPPEPYKKGERVTAVNDVVLGESGNALLLVLRDGCKFCADSMPFYKRLIAANAGSVHRVRTVAVVMMEQDKEKAVKYVSVNGLSVDAIVTLTREQHRDLRVVGTPTLILLDRNGAVEDQWVGKLDEAGEQQVIERITTVGQSSTLLGSGTIARR